MSTVPASEPTGAGASSTELSEELLAAYRHRVADIASQVHAQPRADHLLGLLQHDELAPVLRQAGNPHEIIARGISAAVAHRCGGAATAAAPGDTLRIFLLQQIDLAWWRDAPDFHTVNDLITAPGMERLSPRDPSGLRHQPASDGYVQRARNKAVRRFSPTRRPGDSGLSHPLVRPPVARMLRVLAAGFRARGGEELWINSLARPVDHQVRLQQLGFTAFLPSAHCRGWAADVERAWHEQFGTRWALDAAVGDLVDAGMVNAIDEGSIWHLCPSPAWVATLADQSDPPPTP